MRELTDRVVGGFDYWMAEFRYSDETAMVERFGFILTKGHFRNTFRDPQLYEAAVRAKCEQMGITEHSPAVQEEVARRVALELGI